MSKVAHFADIFKKLPCGCTFTGYLGHAFHLRRSFVDSLYNSISENVDFAQLLRSNSLILNFFSGATAIDEDLFEDEDLDELEEDMQNLEV